MVDVGRLAASHRETWQRLVEQITGAEPCPPELVRALLAIDDPEGWARRIFQAFTGLNPDDGMTAHYEFRRWLLAGILRGLPADHIAVARTRYANALDDTGPAATQHARELIAAITAAGDSEPHRLLLGRAHLVLARRLGEDGDHDGAIAAAHTAEEIFAGLGDVTWRAQAVRMHGAALLRLHKIDEAFAVLDTVTDAPTTMFANEGAYRYRTPEDPIELAFARAAGIATWSTKDAPEWVSALGGLAERAGHRGCAERFAAGERVLAAKRAEEHANEPSMWDRDDRII